VFERVGKVLDSRNISIRNKWLATSYKTQEVVIIKYMRLINLKCLRILEDHDSLGIALVRLHCTVKERGQGSTLVCQITRQTDKIRWSQRQRLLSPLTSPKVRRVNNPIIYQKPPFPRKFWPNFPTRRIPRSRAPDFQVTKSHIRNKFQIIDGRG
jgi:hypothetical protein